MYDGHCTRHQCLHVIKAAQALPLQCLNVIFNYKLHCIKETGWGEPGVVANNNQE